MFLRTSQKPVSRRKAAILLVVLTMLALFAVIGLSFVLYAESEANAARIAKEGVQAEAKVPDASEAVNSFLGQVIYSQDVPGSALYGQDFARHVYGYAGNTTTYNGFGVYREPLDLPNFQLGTLTPPLAATSGLSPLDRTQVVRFGTYRFNPLTPNEFVTIDPDRVYGDGYVERNTGTYAKPMSTPTNPHFVPRNSPYTYPDRKNIYLAVMDPATGQVVKPSYHQPELFTTTVGTNISHLDSGNPNWYNPQGHFKTLRTRPVEHLTDGEIQFLKNNFTWPIPANLTQAQANTLANIFNGNNAAATAQGLFTKTFPFPVPNPDGSITGDVQNIKYADGRQRFDSLWIDPNLPIKKFKGRNLKPMIAATILPMDGRVNYNVAGNKAGGTMAPLTSSSHMGFSAAEINLSKVLSTSTDDQLMLAQRYDTTPAKPSTRGSTNIYQLFHPDPNNPSSTDLATYPPTYSPVDFDGNGAGQPANPTNFSTSYSYPAATYGNSNTTEATRPSVMFNPYQWNPLAISGSAQAGAGSQFPLSDARWLNARYSEKSSITFPQTNLGRQFSTEFTPSYPTAAANLTRALLTPASNRLARPGLSPSFFGNAYTNMAAINDSVALNYNAGNLVMALQSNPTTPQNWSFDLYRNYTGTNPSSLIANPTGANDPKLIGGDAETAAFGSTATLNAANLRAILQGVDLNRPLPDYRDPVNAPTKRPTIMMGPNAGQPDLTKVWNTDPTTMTTASIQKATESRQKLAEDIFHRLCIACGARVIFNSTNGTFYLPQPTGMGTYTLVDTPTPPPMGVTQHTWTVTQSEYDAIRFLAQFSVNLVDAIDPDDISTTFEWNPDPAVMPVSSFASTAINDRVVFGYEKPKLLINEGYAEIANAEDDYGANRARLSFDVRFFLELLNPSMLQNTANPSLDVENFLTSPTPLISDVRNHSFGNLGATPLQYPTSPTPYSVYRIQVYNSNNVAVLNELTNRATNNVLGRVTAAAPVIDCSFLNMTSTAGNITILGPNNGAFSATIANPMTMTPTARNGFCVVGPYLNPAKTEATPTAYAPETADTTKVESLSLMKPPLPSTMPPPMAPFDSLYYRVTQIKGSDINPTYTNLPVVNQPHTVVLQRLANPYLPPLDNFAMITPATPYNPYITIDFMPNLPIHDAIRVGSDNGNGMGTRTAHPVPMASTRSSSVRRQPFVGNDSLGTKAVADTNPTPPSYYSTRQQPMTFFRHNSATSDQTTAASGTDTILNSFPFKEPTHYDRRLVNPLEMLHINRGPSHEATWFFASAGMMMGTTNFYQNEMTPFFTLGTSPLMRALEVLNTKPWTRGLPVGGRVPGGININAIYDEDSTTNTSKVFAALLDKQPANTFTAADVTTLWKNIKETKYPSVTGTVPAIPTTFGPTVDEIDVNTNAAGKDRPFKGFGLGLFSVAPTGPLPLGLTGGVPTATGHDDTLLRQSKAGTGVLALATNQTNPYYALEPLRKAYNNLTTTSDTYMIVFTVGFFDIDEATYNGGTGRVVMRREAYDQVPGDLRSQYMAIIDRSNLGVGLDANGSPQSGSTGTPWFTELVQAPQRVPVSSFSNPSSMAFPSGRNRWYVRFHATDYDKATNTLFVDYDGRRVPIGSGTRIRLGTGPNAEVVTVVGLGVRYDPVPMPPQPTDIPAFDNHPSNTPAQNTGYGYGTVTFDLAEATMTMLAQEPLVHIPGEAVTGDVIPGSPGSVFGFDPTNPNFSGVVRFFGRLKP